VPKRIKTIEADATLTIEASGKISDVDLAWDGWKPDLKMRKCALRKIKAWSLPRTSGAGSTRCRIRLTLEPP
jgi:hypothetical protein